MRISINELETPFVEVVVESDEYFEQSAGGSGTVERCVTGASYVASDTSSNG